MRAPRKGQAAIFNLTRELGARPALSSALLESALHSRQDYEIRH
jgi:hypothetical protein